MKKLIIKKHMKLNDQLKSIEAAKFSSVLIYLTKKDEWVAFSPDTYDHDLPMFDSSPKIKESSQFLEIETLMYGTSIHPRWRIFKYSVEDLKEVWPIKFEKLGPSEDSFDSDTGSKVILPMEKGFAYYITLIDESSYLGSIEFEDPDFNAEKPEKKFKVDS